MIAHPKFRVFCLSCVVLLPKAFLHAQPPSRSLNSESVAGYIGAAEPATPNEIYGQGVRETNWKTPEEEQAGFHLPPGFTIELFASEPQIAKPLNMAWDTRGRLWVTSTVEYPYPAAEPDQARDTVQILEDTDGDGRADRSTTFADRLNIPMGVLPTSDGAICFSIPSLWHLRDVDGDDRVDERVPLLGPFDTSRDTHGMVNALRDGEDGWIYACHGFNNQSHVTASDGSNIRMNSGNTFRFRRDGSRIEHYTRGQVNPFGMTRDEWGNWYSADCHSTPLTALLPGGCYPSFGRPHDGLGFAPPMMTHLHGSTAIGGLAYYQAENFPAAYRHLFFSGNVMTSRLNCDALQRHGSTAIAGEMPDFLTSDDPWFRPVDIQLGPDGALYVADFYNKIIGHYEVPLEHPGRDRNSGRIWRISYHGTQPHAALEQLTVNAADWQKEFGSPNTARRSAAVRMALDTGQPTSAVISQALGNTNNSEALRISCLKLLFLRGDLQDDTVTPASQTPRLLTEWLRLAAELPIEQARKLLAQVRQELPYTDPQANRAALRLFAVAGNWQDIPALAQFTEHSSQDPALSHSARIAIRDLLRDPIQLDAATAAWNPNASLGQATAFAIHDRISLLVAEVLPSLNTALAAKRLLDYVSYASETVSDELMNHALNLATEHATDAMLTQLLQLVTRSTGGETQTRVQRFQAVCDAYLANHTTFAPQLLNYGGDLQLEVSRRLIDRLASSGLHLDWIGSNGQAWPVQHRRRDSQSAAGSAEVELRSSFLLGERYTGSLVSEPFECPPELRFWIAGHNGPPASPDQQRNLIQLKLAGSGQIVRSVYPPRQDAGVEVVWDLTPHAGEMVTLHATDGDAGTAYAWLAVGEFSFSALNPSTVDVWMEAYASLLRRGFGRIDASELERQPLSVRQRARLTLAALVGQNHATAATLVSQALELSREDLITIESLGQSGWKEWLPLANALAAQATASEQRQLVKAWLTSTDGCEILHSLLQQGSLGPHCLIGLDVLFPSGLNETTRVNLEQQLSLAAGMAETGELRSEQIAKRIAGLDWSTAELDLGKQLYVQHCAVCHQLGGQGSLVGPQLDGAIVRGPSRLCEDILHPNLNVDKAFRVSAMLLDDDTVLTGLVRDDGLGSLVVTSTDGKSQTIPASRVEQRRDQAQSLMPDNFGELLNDRQLVSLLQYLQSAATASPASPVSLP